MKLAAIRKKLRRHSENQAFAEQIEQINKPLSDVKNNDDDINKTSQGRIRKVKSEIQDFATYESILFWQMYFLKLAVKSDSYSSLMRYGFLKVCCYQKKPRSEQFNRNVKILKFALNRNNWKRIKNNIRSKYQGFVNWSSEPESAWFPLIVTLGLYFYFILPEDFIPDLIPIIGFIDDFIPIIFVIIWFAIDLNESIVKLSESEARKYIFILKLIFTFGIAGVVSAISVKFLMQIWAFLYT